MKEIFKDKVVIVTGAAFGIGRATALAFAKRGARLLLADVSDCTETIDLVKAEGAEAAAIACDVSDAIQVQAMVNEAVKIYGRIDYACNNAGIEGQAGMTAECTEDNWNRTIGVNLTGTWLCMKYELLQMLRQGNGSIVNMSSVAGLVGFENSPAYVASKHGLIGLTRTAALEYAKSGIRVNAICPGVIHTPMVDRVTGKDKAVEKQFADMEPIGRLGRPEEVAEAVMWLCSDASSFVTGHALTVDGGWVAR